MFLVDPSPVDIQAGDKKGGALLALLGEGGLTSRFRPQ